MPSAASPAVTVLLTVLTIVAPLAPATDACVLSTEPPKTAVWFATTLAAPSALLRSDSVTDESPIVAVVVAMSVVVAADAAPAITPPLPAFDVAKFVSVPSPCSCRSPAASVTPSPIVALLPVLAVAIATLAPTATMPTARPSAWAACDVSTSVPIAAVPVPSVTRLPSPMVAVPTASFSARATVALTPTSAPDAPTA